MENQFITARLCELAQMAYKQNRYCFSHFLSPAELSDLEACKRELSYMDYETWGGNPICERMMVRFGSKRLLGYDMAYPISILKVEPLMKKFAEKLGHRDYLGAIMNLGLERDVIGDILMKDEIAYVFCEESVADYLCTNLDRIKHTSVKVSICEGEVDALKPHLEEMELLVASNRFDAIVASVCKLSRSEAQGLFREKQILLNGRICENNSMELKEETVFSVRGYGKFIFVRTGNASRKGKLYIHIKKYC